MKITQLFKKLVVFILLIGSLTIYGQGPNAPEASAFEPVDATDMVSLLTGDFTYVMPLIKVPSPEGGYPIALSYHAGIAMNQEASWVGLGWSLNPGTINRNVNGSPDDWKDALVKEFAYDVGGSESTTAISVGFGIPGAWSVGVGASWGSNKSLGGSVSASIGGVYGSIGTDGVSVGLGINNQIGVGASVGFNGSVGLSTNFGLGSGSALSLGIGYGPEGLNGNISISQVTTGRGARSSLGISLSSSSINFSAGINGLGTSQSMAFSNSAGSSDYNVTREKSGFMIITPWAYFSFGKNKISWKLSKTTNMPTNGTLYSGYPTSIENFRRTGFPKKTNHDAVAISTEKLFEKSMATSLLNYANGLLPNIDNYNVTAQGLGGNLKPTFINNVGIIGASTTFNISNSIVSSGFQWLNYNIPDSRKKLHFDFTNYNTSFLKVYPKNMQVFQNNNYPVYGTDISFSDVEIGGLSNTPPIVQDSNYSFLWREEVFSDEKKRRRNGRYVEYFTNEEINSGEASSKGFLDVPNASSQRDISSCGIYVSNDYQKNNNVFKSSIGAYKITSTDGKTYHYSLPVYQMEQVRRLYGLVNNKTENQAHVDRMNLSPYATHWLLTAITGPDYVKKDVNRNYPDEGDYGYWVRFDYGEWSGGYTWKTPNGQYSENVDVFGKVKEYRWGRKQIYYLDKIKTRTHSAIFIKSLREDNKSAEIIYKNLAHHKIPSMQYMDVDSHPLLKLDKILLLKNSDATTISKNSGAPLLPIKNYNYYLTGIQTNYNGNVIWEPTEAYQIDYSVNKSTNVYDIYDLSTSGIENKALKVINFNHNYSLATGSPNSNFGKLTLNNVDFRGKANIGLIPPIKFSYTSNYGYNVNNKNDFGYYRNKPEAWSLNKITTPTGASINIDYESDSYENTAIKNGKVFTSQLKFTFITEPPHGGESNWPTGITKIKVEVDNQDPSANGLTLSDYFNPTEPFFMDMWYSAIYNHPGSGYDRSSVNIDAKMANILELNEASNYMIIEVLASSPNFRDVFQHSAEPVSVLHAGGSYNGVENQNLPRYELAWTPEQGWRKYSMRHTLIGNKLRPNDGFGIRVKEISIVDSGKSYKTFYDYNDPTTNQSSGVIPYYPEPNYAIKQQVPYVSLLPAPIITYKYVTESDGENSKRYKFKVLEELIESNNSASFGDLLQISCSEINQTVSFDKVKRKKISINDNFKSLGRLEELVYFNSKNQILSTKKNIYKDIGTLDFGQIKQSFYSKKTLGAFNSIGSNTYGSTTTKDTKASILEKTIVTKGGYTNTQNFKKYDFLTGQVLETTSNDSKGNAFKTEIIPAYTIPEYSQSLNGYGMGSKVDDVTNKNMLTQPAISKTYIDVNGTWQEASIGITTWNNKWAYTNSNGSITIPSVPQEQIWRKHKSFVWDGDINENGAYREFTGVDDNFNWAIAGVNEETPQPNSKWKNTSTTTKYNHYSIPLEVKDINTNYVATKMCDKDSKVSLTSNARYGEAYYSGAEYAIDDTYLDQGVKGVGYRTVDKFHTGKYALKISTNQRGFETVLLQDQHKVGKYKISVWIEKQNASNAKIHINGVTKTFNGERITAGDWIMRNHYENLDSSNETIFITSTNGTVYIDDFRIHPIASTMTSYVYNEWDELTFIIGTNNLAICYVYDSQGRLSQTFTEAIDSPTITGGFKKVSENFYNYKNQ